MEIVSIVWSLGTERALYGKRTPQDALSVSQCVSAAWRGAFGRVHLAIRFGDQRLHRAS